MPRQAREKSESGIYHVLLRGANRQEIFHEDEDNLRFLETLAKYTQAAGTKVYGWCLMDNHVHLLLHEGREEISVTMKRIGVSFAWYYNWKYKTTGHLFQDRFKSETVESDPYLLTVIRYIHQNPVKAGIVRRVEDWKWSSCHGYYGSDSKPPGLLDSDFILGMFAADKETAIARFKEFNEAKNSDKCLEDETSGRMTDADAKQEIIKRIKGIEGIEGIEIAQVKSLPKDKRDKVLREIKKIEGISQRQAARILGISPNLVFKA